MSHLVLIPGFLGFDALGQLSYYGHVERALKQLMPTECQFHVVPSPPTSSLLVRAKTVGEQLSSLDGDIFLIGHSTGGLDARLLCAPQVELDASFDRQAVADRVRAIVTVATPHYGASLASAFNSMLGQSLLQAVSLVGLYSLTFGKVPLKLTGAVAPLLVNRLKLDGTASRLVEQLVDQLIRDFDQEAQEDLSNYLQASSKDQALLTQLSVDSMEVFNATVRAAPNIRYGSVVTKADRPRLAHVKQLGFSPSELALYGLYASLHKVVGAALPEDWAPPLDDSQADALTRGFGEMPQTIDSDGFVSTLSQAYGEVLFCAAGDHHDVIGYFRDDQSDDSNHVDWLRTGDNFGRDDFHALWRHVAEFLTNN